MAWQRGMLLPWAQSQVSFLKDLVTLRNPRSRFSFVNYLHAMGRLDDFVNLGSFTPYRVRDLRLPAVGRRLADRRCGSSYGRRLRSDRAGAGRDGEVDRLAASGSPTASTIALPRPGRRRRPRRRRPRGVRRRCPRERVIHSTQYLPADRRAATEDGRYRVGGRSAARRARPRCSGPSHQDLPNAE